MSYICKNPECSAPENKKGKQYPAAMECPFCDSILVQEISFSDSDLQLINSLPYVIAYPLRRSLLEQHQWTKINLLKDTFLNYLKYLSLITASEFFNSNLKDKQMVSLFQQALAEPTFGTWNQFIREAQLFLIAQNHSFFCEDLVRYYEKVETGKKRKLYKGEIQIIDGNGNLQIKKLEANAIAMLINFRNRFLGHGLTLDEGDSKKLWEEYYPIFKELLLQMTFVEHYPMFKQENGETYLLKSAEIVNVEKGHHDAARVWIESSKGESMDILPFFVVPGEVSLAKEDKEQLFTYESYTGKTIKFFSPEGTEKQTSGKILEKLNLLLREKQKEQPFLPSDFTKEQFLIRVKAENIILVDTLIAEKKVIPGVYVHREDMEIKLREWIGARANIFFIAAEAGSGKTNLLVEIQKQYAERDLPSLLIRAGRMEKQSLKNQIAYLLNIDISSGIENYSSIAGTQDHPTFILIDGINEANNAEELWQEIIVLSELFQPGSLKFIITNRANTKADLARYQITEDQSKLLYGENKDNERGLEAYVFWLTALDMNEMKTAWENYIAKDKSRFKPLFSFDDIATFDRSIYNQINNPLILRLFLEIYNGKQLPKKGAKHLHVWQDWLNTFSEVEQRFLKLLAKEIWEKGENELLLDDLLKHEILKSYFTSDIINSPYNRLKNNGWISRYVKDLNGYVGFTVEGALLYLLGLQLDNHEGFLSLNKIQQLLNGHIKLKKNAVHEFMSNSALKGDLSTVIELIDLGSEFIEACFKPVFIYLKKYTYHNLIINLFNNSTNNDWEFVLKFISYLEDLQEFEHINNLLFELKNINNLDSKEKILIALKTLDILNGTDETQYRNTIDSVFTINCNDHEILNELGRFETKKLNYKIALDYYKKSYELRENSISGNKKFLLAKASRNVGVLYQKLNDYEKSLIWKTRSLSINMEICGENSTEVAFDLNSLGVLYKQKGDFNNAIDFFEKSYNIFLRKNGKISVMILGLTFNIAMYYSAIGEIKKSKEYYLDAIYIARKLFRLDDVRLLKPIKGFADFCYTNGFYLEAKGYFEELLDINKNKKLYNESNEFLFISKIGSCYLNLNEINHAIEIFLIALKIRTDGGVLLSLGECQEKAGLYNEALNSYVLSSENRVNNLLNGIENIKTIESIEYAKRLAKKIGKESELPNWMI